MKLFKRKEKPLSPAPIPETWDWDSMVGYRVHRILNEDPGVLNNVTQMGVRRFSIYFEKVGTATLDLLPSDDGQTTIVPAYWVAHDPDAARRGPGIIDYAPDGSARLTEATSPMEQTGRRLTAALDDGNVLMMPASWPIPDQGQMDQLKRDPRTQKIQIATGDRAGRHVYVPNNHPLSR